MTQPIAIDKIQPNPWQTRLSDDPEHIQRLADDIKANGLLQTPLARAVNGHYELAFGHSRLAAWKLARPQEPFPLDVKDLTDRQLSDFAASENAQRRNLSAIETATAIDRRIRDFKLTQLEAAQPFGIESQGGVSNLLRLLKLPEPVRVLVQTGKLPERHARSLIPLARANADAAAKVATQIAGAEDRVRDSVLEKELELAYQKHGQSLNNAPWDKEWPAKPIDAAATANDAKGEPSSVPACAGCEFHVNALRYGAGHCLRRPCYNLKMRLYATTEVARIAKETGIPAAAADEKTEMVYDGAYRSEGRQTEVVQAILKSKHPSLRIVALKNYETEWQRKEVLGSKLVALASVDLPALKASVKQAAKLTQKPEVSESDRHANAVKAREAMESDRHANAVKAREAMEREQEMIDRLIEAAAPLLAASLVIDTTLLKLMYPFIQSDLNSHISRRVADIEWLRDEDWAKLPAAKQKLLFASALLEVRIDTGADTIAGAREAIQLLTREAKAKFPKGWDANIEQEPPTKKEKTKKAKAK